MQNILEKINHNVIGKDETFTTCFGKKPMIYADYTASGRGLAQIETYINQHVMPWYANTHTETSYTGAQTSKLREEAKLIIRQAVNASTQDKVIFCGSGATAAINRVIDILGIRIPSNLSDAFPLCKHMPAEQRPVVFIGPYEHHSNELPWRESIADVVPIPLQKNGQIDIDALESALTRYASRPLKIGSFSAASNVTGVKSDIARVTKVLKAHNALAFWDYAAAAPYVKIDVNADDPIDAVFISPHKFIGGPGTPGILIAKSHLFKNRVPSVVGGGTVAYVTPHNHQYVDDPERREEGGTPAIIESIRAGLVFKLQQEVGTDIIEKREHAFIQRAMQFFSAIPQIEILGPHDADRLSILSLRFKHNGLDLHYGFVTALLNDLFGIQARGGCSCAGPYGHSLLGMNQQYSKEIEKEISKGEMVLRPGWVRLNFNYFIAETEFNYLLNAIKLIAENGWKLLPFYKLDRQTAIWRFQGENISPKQSLLDFQLSDFIPSEQRAPLVDYDALLSKAERILNCPDGTWKRFDVNLNQSAEKLRWFVLPQECHIEQSCEHKAS